MREKEFPPLLANGFKDINEQDLYKEFVAPFNQGEDHRTNLLIDFNRFLNEFKSLGVAAEVWIDGSFATLAPDPSDVDVLFYFDPNDVDGLAKEKREKYVKLFQSRKFIKNLYHVEVHYAERNNPLETAEWGKTFGTWYDNVTPKGIFRLYY